MSCLSLIFKGGVVTEAGDSPDKAPGCPMLMRGNSEMQTVLKMSILKLNNNSLGCSHERDGITT